jgi:hypothetical protein
MLSKVRALALASVLAGCHSNNANQSNVDASDPGAGGTGAGGTGTSSSGGAGGHGSGATSTGAAGSGGAASGGAGGQAASGTGGTGVAGGTGTSSSGGAGGNGGSRTTSTGSGGAAPGGAGGQGTGGVAATGGAGGGASQRVSVLQHHNHANRDGLYVDKALTKASVVNMHMDSAFAGATTQGPTFAQPLYLAGSGSSPDLVIVATDQNHVYGFDAAKGGKAVWDKTLGTPLPKSRLATLRQGCGNIDPLGITGTPVIDPDTRTIYLDAMIIESANATAQHQVFALDADTGNVKQGWPVDLNSTAVSGSTTFTSLAENQRGALALLDGRVIIPFGGHIGDCGVYHGWIVSISTTDPTKVSAWATRAIAGGMWAPSGVSSDGKSIYFATGNTQAQSNSFTAPSSWQDGETVFRLPSSLSFSGQSADYYTPKNWADLDDADSDLGGTGPIVLDVPGAKPSAFLLSLGKDGNAYLIDRTTMGGISEPTTKASVATGYIINAAATYSTPKGQFVVFKGTGKGCPSGQSGGLAAIKISAASPPTMTMAWCGGPRTSGSPAVSTSDDQGNDAIVWIAGNDSKLYALDGETGQAIFSGGKSSDTMTSVNNFQTAMVANGRVFVAASSQVYAFTPN